MINVGKSKVMVFKRRKSRLFVLQKHTKFTQEWKIWIHEERMVGILVIIQLQIVVRKHESMRRTAKGRQVVGTLTRLYERKKCELYGKKYKKHHCPSNSLSYALKIWA